MVPPVAQLALVYVGALWVGFRFQLPIGPLIALSGALLVFVRIARWPGLLGLACGAGLLAGAVAGKGEENSCRQRWEPRARSAIIRLTDTPGARGMAKATVLYSPDGCVGSLTLRFASHPADAGAVLVVVGESRFGGALNVRHARSLRGHRIGIKARIRRQVTARVRSLYGPRAPLVEALVLGRKEGIDPELRLAFAGAGLAHLLAISGLHVGFLTAWLIIVFGWVLGRSKGEIVAIVVTWGYVGVLGFPAPATRAATFLTLGIIARYRQRRPPLAAVIGVAGLVILTVDPRSVAAVGSWLSVSAVLGTQWASGLLGKKRPNQITRLLLVSFGATLATAPLTAFTFGTVAPVGILANLPAVPLASLVVPAVFASLLGGAIPAAAAGVGLTGIEGIADFAARLPGAQITGEPGWAFAWPWACLVIVLVWFSKVKPRRKTILVRSAWLAAAVSWGSFLITRPPRADGELTVFVLATGQGDAIAVRTPAGNWILIDAGPRFGSFDAGRSVVAPFLRQHGVRGLAAVVVSHGDADHLGGVPTVLEQFPVEVVLEPAQPLATGLYREFLGAVQGHAGAWRAARTADTLTVDGVTFAVLHPSAGWIRANLDPNENSVVLHMRYGQFDMLFAGDAGFPVENVLANTISPVEVLKVGHHGSAGSTGTAWLQALSPQAAVISVGENRYGHPSQAALRRISAAGAAIFRTDQDGTVTIRTNGRYFAVSPTTSDSWTGALRCTTQTWLRFRGSSWTRNACTKALPANSRTFFTTLP